MKTYDVINQLVARVEVDSATLVRNKLPAAGVNGRTWLILIGEKAVERVWESGDLCTDCKYFESWKEPHGERLTRCRILESGEYTDCPGFNKSVDILLQNADALVETPES